MIELHAPIKRIGTKPMKGDILVKIKGFAFLENFTVCYVSEIRETGPRLQTLFENPI
jgi:hypothetical protein